MEWETIGIVDFNSNSDVLNLVRNWIISKFISSFIFSKYEAIVMVSNSDKQQLNIGSNPIENSEELKIQSFISIIKELFEKVKQNVLIQFDTFSQAKY